MWLSNLLWLINKGVCCHGVWLYIDSEVFMYKENCDTGEKSDLRNHFRIYDALDGNFIAFKQSPIRQLVFLILKELPPPSHI